MEQQWFFSLLENAKEEIKRLRAENSLMAARLEMFDSIMSVFNAQKPQQGRGMSFDIVYDIEKVIEEFKPKDDLPKTKAETLCMAGRGPIHGECYGEVKRND